MSLATQVAALATRIATEIKALRAEMTSVTPMRYGAVGDGTTDDTTAIQAAFDSGRQVVIDRPYTAGSLTASSGLTVVGTDDGVLKRPAGKNYTISINPGSGGSSDPSTNIRGVKFIGVTFDDDVATNTFRQGDAQLNLNACSDVLVQRCRFIGFRSDAIYLGSSNTGATERHNQRVKIVHNWFDGVNNDNRNAISVIDGQDVLIQGNSFINCTRSNMPGAIDCEPNVANTFAVLRDITVADNTFRAVGGNGGVVCFWVPIAQTALTTTMRNVVISGNVMADCPNPQGIFLQQSQNASATTPMNNFEFFGNVVSGIDRPFEIGGLRGVRVHDNTFSGTTVGSALGYQYKVRNVAILNNVYSQVGTTSGTVHEIYNADVVAFEQNSYIDVGLTDGTYGVLHKFTLGSGGTGGSSFIDAFNNRVSGTGYTAFQEKNASHTTTPSQNFAGNNRRVDPTGNTNTEITAGTSIWAVVQAPADGSVTDAKVASDAAIAESKLALASDAAAGTASRRTLGTGAAQAAAGNDSRLSDTRTPTDGTVTDAKVNASAAIAETKLSLASDAAAGTASRRTLGTGSTQAAAGNHTHADVPTSRTISTTAPLTGGGDLSANRTLAITTGTTSGTVALGDHTHATVLVPSPPYAVTYSSAWATSGTAWTIDASAGNNVKTTATGNLFLNPPSNPTDGQMLMVSVLASGGARTVTVQGTIQLTTGMTSAFAITSAKVGFFGLRYSALSGNWTLLAQTTEL